MPKLKICPSILAADFARLGDEIARLERSGADMIHMDVMDGDFVDNITIGPPVIKALRRFTKLPFDVHLMVSRPERHLEAFADAGADILTVHAEACAHLDRALSRIRELGPVPAVALNPHTPLAFLDWVLGSAGMVLLMAVNPGFGGQPFIPHTLEKIRALRARADAAGLDLDIEVDGGLGRDNIGAAARAGASAIVMGSALYRAADMRAEIAGMRAAAELGAASAGASGADSSCGAANADCAGGAGASGANGGANASGGTASADCACGGATGASGATGALGAGSAHNAGGANGANDAASASCAGIGRAYAGGTSASGANSPGGATGALGAGAAHNAGGATASGTASADCAGGGPTGASGADGSGGTAGSVGPRQSPAENFGG
jgi:ribulose-phosphate 3-epimerase